MSIVKMKRLRLIGLVTERDELLKRLLSLGCLEISRSDGLLADPEYVGLVGKSEGLSEELKNRHTELVSALAVLDKYAPKKTSLFVARRGVTEKQLFDSQAAENARAAAAELRSLEAEIAGLYAEENRLDARRAALGPWIRCDIPLETAGTRDTTVKFLTAPASADLAAMKKALAAATELADVDAVSADKDQNYLVLVCHHADEEAAAEALRPFGVTQASFEGLTGTAADNAATAKKAMEKTKLRIKELETRAAAFAADRDDLQIAVDRSAQDLARDEAREKLLLSGSVFVMQGWVPVPQLGELQKLLSGFCCAWDTVDPQPGEDVPVKLKNNGLTGPLNMVTEMYSLPAYDGIDPNPLIMPFFTLFFGIMYADIGYGIILTVLGILGRRLIKRRSQGLKNVLGLLTMCGITTIVFGVLFGSCFGDAIPVITDLLGLKHTELWSIINPMENPMEMLLASLAVGCVQLIVGMAVKAYMLIRDGHPLDALFDIGSWWLLFAGLAVGALTGSWTVCLLGVAALVLTQGRGSPTIPGKLLGGVASLYNITSYFGDVLSYSRLMALMLASTVIASVFNVLGSLSGSIVVFIIVFLIGHAFNMGLNLIGTYVHDARLQYLEFFGKFYKEGGRPFRPLAYKTKYTDIIKEEN